MEAGGQSAESEGNIRLRSDGGAEKMHSSGSVGGAGAEPASAL